MRPRISIKVVGIAFSLLAIVLIAYTIIFPFLGFLHAKETGREYGESLGTVVGTIKGSYDGWFKGIPEGYEEGKAEGLSAEDTAIALGNEIKSGNSLQVLVANVRIPFYHEHADKYKALYQLRGNAVFTIDLNQVEVVAKGGSVEIILPMPTAVTKIDHTETELLAERQRKYFGGKAEDGFEAYLNSLSQIENHSAFQIDGFDGLMKMACESAEEQFESIASSVRTDKIPVTVCFREGGVTHG